MLEWMFPVCPKLFLCFFYYDYFALSQWTLKKKFERLIFPTKYVIPKKLKFSHWPSKIFGKFYMITVNVGNYANFPGKKTHLLGT